ncbi:hypothetical protein SteCoe_31315 [Stentor coeruleus]|uniref:Uncharacterized protein n=1 Tax=Stentor coeruleus TaxID=5963 RepID=A0A1R2B1T7_9CILI|nr:hypothetical protein SteCoe_31315 [Stentor coeruleus]
MFLPLLILSVYGELFVSFDKMLDPAPIGWPKTWVANNVELSTNHAGEAAILTLCFSTSIDIPDSNAAITIEGYDANTYYADISATLKGVMITANFDIGNLPVATGSYGPISLVISLVDGGSIIAASQSFATFAIIDSVPNSEALTVTWSTGANSEVSEDTSLDFSFTVTSAIERYDYFVIDLSAEFGFDDSKAEFTWADGSEYFNETSFEYDSDNNCVTVYGIVEPIYENTLVTFTLSGFSNPRAKATSSSWSITFYRFGASTTIEIFGGTLSGSSLTAGAITFNSWTPTNNYIAKAEIVSGLVIYMTLEFTLTHDLIAGDYIDITFGCTVGLHAYTYTTNTEQALNANAAGVLISGNDELDCAFDGSSNFLVTCTANDNFSGKVTITTLVEFGASSPSITTIKSKNSNDYEIDSAGKSGEITYAASSSVVLIDEEVWAYPAVDATVDSAAGINLAADTTTFHFVVSFKAMVALAISQEIEVYYPVDSSDTALGNYLAIPATITGTFSDAVAAIAADTISANTDADLSVFDVSTGIITFQTGQAYSANEYSTQYFGSVSNVPADQYLFTPWFPSQEGSTEEFVLRYTKSNINYIFSKPISFVSNSVADYNLLTFCTDVRLDGAPIQIYLKFPYDYSLTATLYFQIEFTNAGVNNDLGSGLDSGSDYPSDLASDPIITYSETGNTFLTYEFTDNIAIDDELTMTVPFPALSSSDALEATYTLVAVDGNDEYMLWQDTASTSSPAVAANVTERNTDLSITEDAQGSVSSLSFNAFASTDATLAIAIVTDSWLFIDGATIQIDNAAITGLTWFTSTDSAFAYSSAYSSGSAVTTASVMTISSATLPWYSVNSKINVLYGASGLNAACDSYNFYTIPVVDLAFDSFTYTPQNSDGYSYDQQTVDVSLSLAFTGTIYEGSVVTVELDNSQFSFGSATYTISVGNDNDDGDVSGTTITFTTTADTSDGNVSIVISLVTPPEISDADVTATNNVYSAFSTVSVDYSDGSCYAWDISTDDPDDQALTTFAAATIESAVSGASFFIFPAIQGANDVYFAAQFDAPFDIPAGSSITVSGESFTDDTDVVANTWFSEGFSTVSTSTNDLVITTLADIAAGTTIEIRKDLAFSLTSSQVETAIFMITVDDGTYTYVDDSAVTDSVLAVDASVDADISSAEVVASVLNYGAESVLTFTLTVAAEITADTTVAFDAPFEYDAVPGDTVKFYEIPNIRFMYAGSDHGDVWCVVDHWLISCSGVEVPSGEAFSIAFGTRNPIADTSSWSIYIYTKDSWVANPYYNVDVSFVDIPDDNVDFYFVDYAAGNDDFTSDMVFSAYVNENFEANSRIYVEFPMPYELNLYNPDSVECAAVTYDADGNEVSLSSSSTCAVSDNLVEFVIDTAVDVSESYWTFLGVAGIADPRGGFTRSELLDEEFVTYDYWTGKFSIFTISTDVTDEVSCTVTSQSFKNLNAAFTGYDNTDFESFVVNGNAHIYLRRGTFSDWIQVGSENVWATAVSLTASNLFSDGPLVFSDDGNYIISDIYPTANFKVGCAIDSSDGYYYISWTKDYEYGYWEGSELYRAPDLTVVEVTNVLTYNVNIGDILLVPAGFSSFPIDITIADGVSAFDGIDIAFTVSTETNRTITFSTVSFASGMPYNWFTITCADCVDGEVFDVDVEVSGNDADAFTVDTPITFTIGSLYSEAAVATATLDVLSQTEITVKFTSDSWAVVTWALIAELEYFYNDNATDFDYIESQAQLLVGDSEGYTLEEQEAIFRDYLLSIESTSWENFALAVIVEGCFAYYASQDIIDDTADQELYTFSTLIAGTTYNLAAYIDNFSGKDVVLFETSATTTDYGYPAKVSVAYSDASPVDTSLVDSAFSKLLHVVSDRFSTKQTVVSRRNLANGSDTIVLQDPMSNEDSTTLVNSASEAEFISALADEGLTATGVTTSEITDFGTQTFADYNWIEDTDYVALNFTTSVDGTVCCEFEYDADSTTALTSDLIWLGLDRNGTANTDNTDCMSVSAGTYYQAELNLTESVPSTMNWTTITFTCTACNALPILPECLTTGLLNYTFDASSSFGYSLVFALSAIFAYLV